MCKNGNFGDDMRFNALFRISFALAAFALYAGGAFHAEAAPKGWSGHKYAALAVDADDGSVYFSRNMDSKRHPASLTKMMTLYIAFTALKEKRLRLKQYVRVSRHAASQPPMRIGLKHGMTVSVQDLINGIIVKSGNDAAAALAEAISGSEKKFAALMTRAARSMGMSKTVFKNASGLPDSRQITTAADMAVLAQRLRKDHPQYYHLFKKDSFRFNGKTFRSHNHVTKNNSWVDGIKTGYINASGFNLVSSARKNGRNLIGVVMGGPNYRKRDQYMVRMLAKAAAGKYRKGPSQVYAMRPGKGGKASGSVYASRRAAPVPALKPQVQVAIAPKENKAPVSYAVVENTSAEAAPFPVLKQEKQARTAPAQTASVNTPARVNGAPVAVLKPQVAANIAYARSMQKEYESPFVKRLSPEQRP